MENSTTQEMDLTVVDFDGELGIEMLPEGTALAIPVSSVYCLACFSSAGSCAGCASSVSSVSSNG